VPRARDFTSLLPVAALAASLHAAEPRGSKAPDGGADAGVRFVDATRAAGITFVHNSGRAGKRLLPETMGAGGAFFDADGDGGLDVLLVNGRDWKPRGRATTHELYLNRGNGTFRNATKGSGLDVSVYGMGVTIGDYDNDGRDDVYITAFEGDRLYHNEGGGRFKDVTRTAGIENADFGTSAAFLDYDRDGFLDLFVANYVKWTPETDLHCTLDGVHKSYCTPESYKGTFSRLFRGVDGTRFEDVTEKAGLRAEIGKALGVAVLDHNGDGWPDLFVANDTQPNKLWRNTARGTFVEDGVAAGVAFSEDGVARGAMGVDAVDYDGSGREHLVVGNFANEMLGLYHNEGSGLFIDEAPRSNVGRDSLLSLTFGVFFFDYDLDGRPDILTANGHLEEEIESLQPKVKYRQSPLLFRNVGKGQFENASTTVGADFSRPLVGRGAAYGDYDADGDLDVLLTDNHGPARLLRNDGGNRNAWLAVGLRGRKSNTNGLGAVVTITGDKGAKQWRAVRSGSSYCSYNDRTLVFGLGASREPVTVDVVWPSGSKQRLTDVAPGQRILVDETAGLVRTDAAPARVPAAAKKTTETVPESQKRPRATPTPPLPAPARSTTEAEAPQPDMAALLARLEAAPDDLATGNDLRRLCREQRRVGHCIDRLNELATRYPTVAAVRYHAALAYVDDLLGRTILVQGHKSTRSIEHVTSILDRRPEDWLARYIRGLNNLYWPRWFNRVGRAIKDLELCVASTEQASSGVRHRYHALGYVALGDAYVKDGEPERGLKAWGRGLELFPQSTSLQQRAALTPVSARPFVDAARDIDKPIDTDISFVLAES
jgi:enediyne biosynthesis protein E4